MTTASSNCPDDDPRHGNSPETLTSPSHRRRVRPRSGTRNTGAIRPMPTPPTPPVPTPPNRPAGNRTTRPEIPGGHGDRTGGQYGFPFADGQADPYQTGSARRRRASGRSAKNDIDLLAATVTGNPSRVDDATAPFAGPPVLLGSFQSPRSCYVCKARYRKVFSFYHALCPACAALNWARRSARADLRGRRALLTGGRAKIGQEIALRLLRDGADVTITTRFPADAADRFVDLPDYDEWADRLHVVAIDLRQIDQVLRLAADMTADGPVDILINNAAQTVRRTPEAYGPLVARERMDSIPGSHTTVKLLTGSNEFSAYDVPHLAIDHSPSTLPNNEIPAEHGSLVSRAGGLGAVLEVEVDDGGLVPDRVEANSWSKTVEQVDAVEMLEVQLINNTTPFVLISNLRAAMEAATSPKRYVVNVSAVEGQFGRHYKNPSHPHTNMAKAASTCSLAPAPRTSVRAGST